MEIKDVVREIIEQLAEEGKARPEFSILNPGRNTGYRFAATPQVSTRVASRDLKPLNENELKSVYALLAYVAEEQDVAQETVQSIVEASFGVNHVSKLQQKSYDEVIRFLVDLRIDEMRN